jgi:hypothetical protein
MAEQNFQDVFKVERVTPWINPYEYILSTNQGDFIYVPQDIVNKGYVKEENAGFVQTADGKIEVKKENRQFFHPEFLNQDFLSAAKPFKVDEGIFTDAQKSAMSQLVGGDVDTGYLFPVAQYMGNVSAIPFSYELDEDSPPISGISSLSNEGVGGVQFGSGYKYILGKPTSNNFDFINPDSSINTLTTTYTPPRRRGGILGSAARSITGAIAGIPFLPEIVGFATGNPVLYGSLKAAQTAGSGGDIGDTLKAGIVGGGSMYLGQELLGPTDVSAGQPVGGTPGVSEVYPVDMSVGGTVTPLPPGSIGLPPIDLLGGTTFPSQGLSPPTGNELIQAPAAPTPDVSLISPEAVFPGEGLINPTMPGIPSMGGGTGLTVGVPGGTVGAGGFTPEGAVPVLGDQGSFINDPNVIGQPVIQPGTESLSLRDAFDALRSANRVSGLLNNGGGGQAVGGVSDPGQMPAGSVDVSRLLSLLSGANVRTPNVYSLLG